MRCGDDCPCGRAACTLPPCTFSDAAGRGYEELEINDYPSKAIKRLHRELNMIREHYNVEVRTERRRRRRYAYRQAF